MAKESSTGHTTGATPIGRITVDEFAETAFKAVMRAVEAQKFPHGPIIWGIIYQPQALPAEVIQPAAKGTSTGG